MYNGIKDNVVVRTQLESWIVIRSGVLQMGLVEYEWLETLSTVNPDEVQYIDYVEMGNKLSAKLRDEVTVLWSVVNSV